MAEHTWPLRKSVAADHRFLTKADLIEALNGLADDTPLWIDNYWQPVRQIAQRPVDLISNLPDGIHLG